MRTYLPVALLALAGSSTATSLGKAKDAFECLKASKLESCQTKTSIPFDSPETCCYNGAIEEGGKENGLFLATQFWNAQPSLGLDDSTTVHGLWPDYCDGTYPQFCSNVTGIPEYTGEEIRAVLEKYDPKLVEFMDVNYKTNSGTDESFWEHEWNKHATCISTLRSQCQAPFPGISKEDAALLGYFRQIIHLFKKLPTYDWLKHAGIVPSETKTYSLKSIQDALAKKHGGVPFVGCNKQGELNEFWYYYTTKGPVNFAKYIPGETTTKSTCPDQVKYLPK